MPVPRRACKDPLTLAATTARMQPDTSPLFSPYTLANITLKNRFIMPGMQRHWCRDGEPLPQMVEYFRRRVEGGIALVISESAAVDHPAATQQATAGHAYGRALDGWARCIDAVHQAGGCMFMQLWHEGAVRRQGHGGPHPDAPSVSPSGLVQADVSNGLAATSQDLEQIRDAFVRAAVDAKRIGADGVEIHACHGYLLDLFLWAETNRRDDGYGGDDILARVRFPQEIVAAIRDATGPDFVISFRFSQWKEVDFDARIVDTAEELALLLGALKTAGVDVFHPSTRRFQVPEWPGSDLGLAGWTRRLGGKPVIAVGSVGLDIDLMSNLFGADAKPSGASGIEELLRRFNRQEFDLVAVGRAVIGDADWVNKVRDHRYHELRPFSRDDLTAGMEWEMSFVEQAHGR